MEALELQRKAQSTVAIDADQVYQQFLPYDMLVFMFSTYFTSKELVYLFRINKTWLDTLRDGAIWKKLYEQRWPSTFSVESKINGEEITVHIVLIIFQIFVIFFPLRILF